GGRMSVEVDLLLQEAKESIEAAQNYRSELQQRLHGLNQARKQVLLLVLTFLCVYACVRASDERRLFLFKPSRLSLCEAADPK
ncbi:hypothetical protein GOODEAATRI_003638, partial [Goodea atripinnis]